jgi:hypothetical protein
MLDVKKMAQLSYGTVYSVRKRKSFGCNKQTTNK